MALAVKEEGQTAYLHVGDDEDALLNEAICCSRDLEASNPENTSDLAKNLSRPLWCDMDTDSNSVSDTSATNSKSANQSNSFSDHSLNEPEPAMVELELSITESEKLTLLQDADLTVDKTTLAVETQTKIKVEVTDPVENVEIEKEKEITEVSDSQKSIACENSKHTERKRLRDKNTDDDKTDETEAKQFRPRRNSTSSHSTSSGGSKKPVEFETCPTVLARRQKDIDYGKNTIGYDRYIQLVPKNQRTREHPRTPPMHLKYSRRGWDGMVKLWRKQLHFFDPVDDQVTSEDKKIEKQKENNQDNCNDIEKEEKKEDNTIKTEKDIKLEN